MHISGYFPLSTDLKNKNIKKTQRFGNWLCFRHQVKPHNVSQLRPL
jgi:hypothetical protein